MLAAVRGNAEMVRILIEAGADVNAYDKHMWNAVKYAIMNNHFDIVKVLRRAGARD
jgi:ankyrin repeat protein